MTDTMSRWARRHRTQLRDVSLFRDLGATARIFAATPSAAAFDRCREAAERTRDYAQTLLADAPAGPTADRLRSSVQKMDRAAFLMLRTGDARLPVDLEVAAGDLLTEAVDEWGSTFDALTRQRGRARDARARPRKPRR